MDKWLLGCKTESLMVTSLAVTILRWEILRGLTGPIAVCSALSLTKVLWTRSDVLSKQFVKIRFRVSHQLDNPNVG